MGPRYPPVHLLLVRWAFKTGINAIVVPILNCRWRFLVVGTVEICLSKTALENNTSSLEVLEGVSIFIKKRKNLNTYSSLMLFKL